MRIPSTPLYAFFLYEFCYYHRKELSELILHQNAKNEFLSSANAGCITNSYIIDGPEGSGKLTFALFAASVIICSGNKRPCGKCSGCVKIAKGIHPDVHIYDAGESASFKIETVREIIRSVNFVPAEADRKIYIINDAQKMTAAAQNALLKVLEEPPSDTVFFIITEKRDSILPTVLSRGSGIHIGISSDAETEEFIREKYKKITDDEVKKAVSLCCGIPGDAVKLLEKSAAADKQRAQEFTNLIFQASGEMKKYLLLNYLIALKAKREAVVKMLPFVLYSLRDTYITKTNSDTSLLLLTKEIAETYSRMYTEKGLIKIIDATSYFCEAIESNANLTAAVSTYCALICNTNIND